MPKLKNLLMPLLAPVCLLALVGCNALEGRRTDPKTSIQGINATKRAASDPVLDKLAADCAAKQGRLAKAGQVCLTKKTVTLPEPANVQSGLNEVLIDENFQSGMYVVATGNAGPNQSAVDITFANRPFSKIPARMMASFTSSPTAGRLAFYLNTNGWANVSVTVWTCFERTITNRIFCSAEYIP